VFRFLGLIWSNQERDEMRTSRTMVGVAAVASLLLAAAPAAQATRTYFAAAPTGIVTLDLELNEPFGSTVAADSSGFGHNGAIGSHIVMNGSYAKFDRHSPAEGIYYGAAHLIMIDDAGDASLDPGTGNFTVEFRYRSTVKFGNVIQKGQSRTVGGQVKFQQPKGYMSCMFKSPTGTAAVKSSIFLSDGAWHTIRCERTPTEIRLYIDDVLNRRLQHTTGTINNSKPWTIGGKFNCDTSDPTTGADSCDYWAGDLDWVKLYKG
jgi:hypothetical protein